MLEPSNDTTDLDGGLADARLLVMGAERVGKSAAIVRFTTGRFIYQYCPSTQDWLYRHQLSLTCPTNTNQENAPPVLVELLEQKDLLAATAAGPSEIYEDRQYSSKAKPNCSPSSSLALRVASDQRADRELRECQQLLDALLWANAHVIVYSLTESNSFDRAREYLELLDWLYSAGNDSATVRVQPERSIARKLSRRLTSRHHLVRLSRQQRRPPVLLLGNKHDLASNCPETRQVTLERGHELAAEHSCLFAELSTAECGFSLRTHLLELIKRTLPSSSSVGPFLTATEHSTPTNARLTQLIKWQPNQVLTCAAGAAAANSNNNNSTNNKQQQQAWSSLIKTQMPLVSSSHSTQVMAVAGSRLSNGLAHDETATYGGCQPIVAATCQPLVTSSQPTLAATPQSLFGQTKQSSPTNASRYGALKSTFKKASLAIVSGKALASRVSGRHSTGDAPTISALKRNSTASSTLSELVVSDQSLSIRGSIGSLSSCATTTTTTTTTTAPAASGESPPSKLNKSSNWIKSRFSRQESSGSEGKSSQSAIVSNTCELQQPPVPAKERPTSGKFKRPLFKYKARLKTVAFEPGFCSQAASAVAAVGSAKQSSESIQTITTGLLDGSTSGQQEEQQTRASGTTSPLSSVSSSSRSSAAPAGGTHNANRHSSGRSSSSLSTTDTYYSSLFVVCQANSGTSQTPHEHPASVSLSSCRRAPAPPAGGAQRQDSRSTLSRASTSLGSYDEMLEEMESAASECAPPPAPPPLQPAAAAATPPSRKSISSDKPPACGPPACMKTRFQVVKSVQSTLTNLAKSTRATVAPVQPIKRSFCSALMSSSMSLASPRACESADATVAPVQQVAKIEPIRAIPAAVVGYCK